VSAQADIHRGHAVVEIAVVLPLLVVLLLGIWQAGVVYDTWNNLDAAAVDGARAAAAAPPTAALSAGKAAASRASDGQLTLNSFRLDRTIAKGAPAYRATACTSYSLDVLGLTLTRGTLCRQATTPIA
jgi:Flp pilus assembly protein TadG